MKKKLGRVSLFWGSFFYIHSALWRIQLELICLLFTSPCREICSTSKILHSRRFAIPSPHPRLIVDWNLCLQHVLIVSALFVYHGFIFFFFDDCLSSNIFQLLALTVDLRLSTGSHFLVFVRFYVFFLSPTKCSLPFATRICCRQKNNSHPIHGKVVNKHFPKCIKRFSI